MKTDLNPDPTSGCQVSDRALSVLLDLDERPRVWLETVLAKVLRHQLATPLGVDLGLIEPTVDPTAIAGNEDRTGLHRTDAMTFGQLFDDPAPPLDLLIRAKAFAKVCTRAADCCMPEEVAAVICYLSIVVARLRCAGKRISGLGDADLEIGLRTALEWAWLDAQSRATLAEGLRALGDGRRKRFSRRWLSIPAADAHRRRRLKAVCTNDGPRRPSHLNHRLSDGRGRVPSCNRRIDAPCPGGAAH